MKKILLLSLISCFLFADKITIITIPSMHCPLCTTAVKKAIKSVDGVKNASVKLNTKKATIVHEDSLKVEKILEAIKTTSYEGELISTKNK